MPCFLHIRKTDHFFITRLKEHAQSKCEPFQYYRTLFNFSYTLFNLGDFTPEQIIYNNCKILERSKH